MSGNGTTAAWPRPIVRPSTATLRGRMLSVRAFDAAGMMREADLAPGDALEALIERLFTDPAVRYLQVHFAKRGCYAARIERCERG